MELPANACIRTSPKWDKAARHLGYEPVDISPENYGNLRKDTDIIAESQEKLARVEVIPEGSLTPRQSASLALLREVNKKNAGCKAIQAAVIPAASDRVRTAGMYGRHNQHVFMSAEQLDSGRPAVYTGIHEMSHHTSGAEDGEPGHEKEMASLAATVIGQVERGEYDTYLKNPDFVW